MLKLFPRQVSFTLLLQKFLLAILHHCLIMFVRKLTVDEPDCCHGDREEGVRLHADLDQSSSEGEEEEDDDHAGGHTDALLHPAGRRDI